jgi:hypothetical protein
MIKINLSPLFEGDKLTAKINGTTLTVNGTDYELSDLPDGATAEHPILGTVSRNGNDYELTLTLTHGFNAPEDVRFPAPIEVTADAWELDYVYDEVTENDLAE